ncbi:MAG: hypothetical protein ACK53E_03300, partial [Pseudanabaena sp.]
IKAFTFGLLHFFGQMLIRANVRRQNTATFLRDLCLFVSTNIERLIKNDHKATSNNLATFIAFVAEQRLA